MRSISARRRFGVGATISGVSYLALLAVHVSEQTLRAGTTPVTVALYIAAFVGFFITAWANEQAEISTGWLWAIPIAFRILLLFTTPTLSDDVYRYLWDGHLVSEGVNPYTFPISAAELDPYSIDARRMANNPHLSSPYLPTAQLVFGAAMSILPAKPIVMQALMSMFDLASAAVLVKILRRVKLPTKRVVWYLWNPLMILEFAHSAHLDALMIFLSLLAILSAISTSRSKVLSPVALALATLTRPLPALLVPVLWWRWSWPQRMLYGGICLGLILPFTFGSEGWGLTNERFGTGVFGSARVYTQNFRFNAVLSSWIESATGNLFNLVLGLIMVSILLLLWTQARAVSDRQLLRLLGAGVMAYTLLTPVLHPWYIAMLVALAPFIAPTGDEPKRLWLLLLPWCYLMTVLPLSYLTYMDPAQFAERQWVRAVIWYPTLVAAAVLGFVAQRVIARMRYQESDDRDYRVAGVLDVR